ncbi:DUF4123 domain-containing protein [Pseudomonas sp. NFX15]|uniref:DUF4123 domain-containing protein n=1 Tax=Pseudomonas sp. NFX15 TaxID=2816958 RepID=UPI003B8E4308
MNMTEPQQWITEQLKLGRSPCVILDSEGEREARQALVKNFDLQRYRSLYSNTQVAELADAGPFVFVLDNAHDPRITALLNAPQRHWGWLASIEKNQLPALIQHWQERLIIGSRPNQGLYRFHDNRVLARALAHLPSGSVPEYLGPVISACFWQGSHWASLENPAPGPHPVPADPAWHHVPSPVSQSLDILLPNIYRYLWAEHSDAMASLSAHYPPKDWLAAQLAQAQAWGWHSPQQIHFLVLQHLDVTRPSVIRSWLPRGGETPEAHFERLFDEVKFWLGDKPI